MGRLLVQGLPKLIAEGNEYPAIIISGMLPNWKRDQIHNFVEYILLRYKGLYNPKKVYMTGFSAGGGVTIRYVKDYPEYVAAIAAAAQPKKRQPSQEMAKVSSWLFHNIGDTVVNPNISVVWYEALKNVGGLHRLILFKSDNHQAWRETYATVEMWTWLLQQEKSEGTFFDQK